MKYTLTINQKQALELGLTNVNQAVILGLIADAHSWATHEVIDTEVYYWTARQKIAEELPLLDLKADSVYRHLKALSEIGLIDYVKHGKKDCVKLTEKGKSYYVGNKSEFDENSEINPKKLGNKSEKNSEINPTYKNTNPIRATKDKSKKNIKKDFTFSLTKTSQFENISKEYQEKLKAYAVTKDGAYNFEKFLDHHIAKGSTFKDWSRAYNTWISNSIKFDKFVPARYIIEHHHPVTNDLMLQEYGTNNIYCPNELKFLGTCKSDTRPQAAPAAQTLKNDENIDQGVLDMLRREA
ncbi:hypothetical protein [Sulfurimonas sp.]|uniref:hypothetical protein n=1 Tax=Sulfurimonas sp. TaxID=2022749 RepID=UPI003569EE5E